jgi:2,4-dienoyl-CoA reductase-like NADH-dependent reductase (Old Yellow Enzyme family)
MSRVSTLGDGRATAAMRRYYGAYARGGFALIVTEGTYTDLAYSQAYRNQPGLATAAQARAWSPIVDVVHDRGAKFIAQLMHAGALSQENTHRAGSIGPSALLPRGQKMTDYGGQGPYAMPRAMDAADIRDAIDGFARAAVRAREVGFDGVEIHAANGYLLDQFLTTYTNARSDSYGGSVENRIRLTAQVVAAVAAATGPGFAIGVRVSQTKVNDFSYRWPGAAADAAVIFAALRDAGAHYLHVAGEGSDWLEAARLPDGDTLTRVARRVSALPVLANGGLDDPASLALVLNDGHADLVALGRAALANPDWPSRLECGEPFESFDGAMLHPSASLENAERWRAARGSAAPQDRDPHAAMSSHVRGAHSLLNAGAGGGAQQ